MDIYGLANSAIQVLNENQNIIWKKSTGYTTDEETGQRTPQYQEIEIQAQIQPMSSDTLQFVDGMNQGGLSRSVWMIGDVQSVLRSEQRGGDLLIFPLEGETTPSVWKVTSVIEAWQNYAHVVAVLQLDEYDNTERLEPTEPANSDINGQIGSGGIEGVSDVFVSGRGSLARTGK